MFRLKKRSRFNYWGCSKFADWIRGTPKPFALEWDAWTTWHKEAKSKHPFRYWIADELLDILQDIVYLPIDIYYTIEVYIRNRFIDKIHYLKTGLKPGEYYDLDYRILHGLFYELVKLVESEFAHMASCGQKNKYKFIRGRCTQAGLDYLDWSMNLKYGDNDGILKGDKLYGKPTHQAETAEKILELYKWWKNRDNRQDPHELFSKENSGKYYYRKIHKMEESYDKEDTKMLIELIKIRKSLWT
jgi:hypothetical protein